MESCNQDGQGTTYRIFDSYAGLCTNFNAGLGGKTFGGVTVNSSHKTYSMTVIEETCMFCMDVSCSLRSVVIEFESVRYSFGTAKGDNPAEVQP